METQFNLKKKLTRRVQGLVDDSFETYHSTLQQFVAFLHKQPLLMGIIESLIHKYPEAEKNANTIRKSEQGLVFDNEVERMATTYFVLRDCFQSNNSMEEVLIGHKYGEVGKHNISLSSFNRVFVVPFYEYIIEQLDDQSEMLALLIKYKERCEWFQRDNLYELWNSDTARGEKLLAFDLYEYLHDKGIVFNIEPASASGEIDMIALQGTNDPLLADAKIFNSEKGKGKPYIKKGVSQIYNYMCDYNEALGYLVIFTTSDKSVCFNLEKKQGIPRLLYNNKAIFFIVIDIFPHATSASQRKPTDFINIDESFLTSNIHGDEDLSEDVLEI